MATLLLFWAVVRLLPDKAADNRTVIRLDHPSVVRQIQSLARLESVVYRMEKVVEGERANRWFPSLLSGDRILMVVYGEVTAGVELAAVQAHDVHLDDRSLTVKLPSPVVFQSRLDNTRTRVYSRDTGLFTSFDPYLETEVRRAAEEQLREAAIADGILDAAEQNAEQTLKGLLRALQFEEIEIQWRPTSLP